MIKDFLAMISYKYAVFVMGNFSGTRISFYEGFQNLVESGMSVNDSLKELHQVWSYNGKKPDEPLAVVTQDLMGQLSNGTALSKALSRWVPYEEASLLAAGEHGARLVQACDDIIRVIIAKQQIRGAVAAAVVYPTFLAVPLGMLLWMVAEKMIPPMAQKSDPETWTGSGYALYLVSSFVTNFGLTSVVLLLALIIVFTVSLPRWTGSVRMLADRGPFYSTYRMVHGSTFLLNLAVMVRANIAPYDALNMLAVYANPWLKERIEGAMYGIRLGHNLGVALDNAGHNFPDKKAIQFIKILAAREGFSTAINKYSERWLQTSLKQIQHFSKITFTISLIMIGAVMALIVAGTQDIQNNFEQSISRTSPRIVNQ
ncbi:type IV pilus biogenesis integral membrane protein PilR2 (plasmid) [Pseudomonas fluorescens A506]|nr:type IV pilus biogenesis integral membrane protein PilR2 [Pseudomonas fluorescens A506]